MIYAFVDPRIKSQYAKGEITMSRTEQAEYKKRSQLSIIWNRLRKRTSWRCSVWRFWL